MSHVHQQEVRLKIIEVLGFLIYKFSVLQAFHTDRDDNHVVVLAF